MKVKFWGVRGTIATPDVDKMCVGGNTTCVEVRPNDGSIIIFDAGTGLIPCGKSLLKEFEGKEIPKIHLFLSHTHWDHLCGFPFFSLNFIEGVYVDVYGPIKENRDLEEVFTTLMNSDFCPISYKTLPSRFSFHNIPEGEVLLSNNIKIIASNHCHPGGAYGYRVEVDGKVFVFNTDVEHQNGLDERVIKLSKDADLMVHDAQYIQDELKNHVGWGHSSYEQVIKIAQLAGVNQLGFTHHDVNRTDTDIDTLEQVAQISFSNSFFCREGMIIDL